ncbi:MAG TPA: serine/threonine-protein kinase, partial [Gemmataceae bacterium]|nr:serine/threonine-protein kinase [Gemmataceae bacterium]
MVAINHCPRCKSELTSDAPEGLCPECLLQQALAGPGPSPDQEPGRSPARVFIPPPPGELARHFPQLEILELLGQGGMGAVYKARQPKLDRLIAVKILPPEVARDPAFAERFMREARSLARLNHPNIVTIYDFGEAEGLFYFSMEFVDGKNVRQLLEANELPAALALKIVPQVCDALQYAHDEGIVHRDIKPENILLDKRGRVTIADFGLAKIVGLTPTYLTLTGSHEVMGTLYYMAPEQVRRSHVVDHRADLYSLGVVFYEMLTGELPLGRFAPPSHKARVDVRLDAVVLRALAREPEHRFQDAVGLKREVESVVAGGAAAQPAGNEQNRPRVPRAKDQWPNIRFTIPRTTWFGGQARGDIYRDQDTLILEFAESGIFQKAELKELRIPLTDIASMSLKKRFGQLELSIKATRFRTLAELPVGHLGRGRLLVHREDREAARQLVKSIIDSQSAGGDDLFAQKSDLEKASIEVVAPAAGLLVTGILACVGPLIAAIVLIATLGFSVVSFW